DRMVSRCQSYAEAANSSCSLRCNSRSPGRAHPLIPSPGEYTFRKPPFPSGSTAPESAHPSTSTHLEKRRHTPRRLHARRMLWVRVDQNLSLARKLPGTRSAQPAETIPKTASGPPKYPVVYFFFCALTFAHLARCAAAIRALAAAVIVLGPLPFPVAFPGPFSNALACCSLAICSSRD